MQPLRAGLSVSLRSIVREALDMPILCKDIEVFDNDSRTKRRKGSSIKWGWPQVACENRADAHYDYGLES